MLFCPKCGAMMTPKLEKGKKVLACSCGYTNKKQDIAAVREVTKEKRVESTEFVTDNDHILPITDEVCPECNHEHAYWWTKQMRSSDEPETKFLKCVKCKHTWRDRS